MKQSMKYMRSIEALKYCRIAFIFIIILGSLSFSNVYCDDLAKNETDQIASTTDGTPPVALEKSQPPGPDVVQDNTQNDEGKSNAPENPISIIIGPLSNRSDTADVLEPASADSNTVTCTSRVEYGMTVTQSYNVPGGAPSGQYYYNPKFCS